MMNIEVGKFYRTRAGQRVEILSTQATNESRGRWIIGLLYHTPTSLGQLDAWFPSGHYSHNQSNGWSSESPKDLVSEWERGWEEGDVVDAISANTLPVGTVIRTCRTGSDTLTKVEDGVFACIDDRGQLSTGPASRYEFDALPGTIWYLPKPT